MYKILETIMNMTEEHKRNTKESRRFCTKDIRERVGLSHQAVINNIRRLVKAGFLERHNENRGFGPVVTYNIVEAKYDFIHNYLYD